MGRKAAVILCGSGHQDGSEIHEAVFTMYFLEQQGFTLQLYAPNRWQTLVVNHLTGQETDERRHMLVESARIARGQVAPLEEAHVDDFDALVLPGGTGAAFNLCDYASKGKNMQVIDILGKLINDTHRAAKPIGAVCITPVIVARVLGELGVTVTIGHDQKTADVIESFGAQHKPCDAHDCVVDEQHKVVTTPAYMLGKKITDVAPGIEKLAAAVYKFTAL